MLVIMTEVVHYGHVPTLLVIFVGANWIWSWLVKPLTCCVVRVISCLLGSFDKPQMTDECRNSLMEVFYFISRDFK